MATILTYDELQATKPMTTNDKIRLTQFIFEIENYDICKLIGRDTYFAILADSQLPVIERPVYYQSIYNNGLKYCISFLVYAKYQMEGNIIDTFSGAKTKNSEYSQNANVGALKNIASEYREQAIYFLNLVIDDINKYYGKGCSANKDVRVFNGGVINIYGKK